jgi:hypothetical protein
MGRERREGRGGEERGEEKEGVDGERVWASAIKS